MVDFNELERHLCVLLYDSGPTWRSRDTIRKWIAEAGKEYERAPLKFIFSLKPPTPLALRPPAPPISPPASTAPRPRMLLDKFLYDAYQALQDGAFDDQPPHIKAMYEAYCTPPNDKYGRYLDEMTEKQRRTLTGMNECMIAHKYKKSQLEGSSNIEDALDNVIKNGVKNNN